MDWWFGRVAHRSKVLLATLLLSALVAHSRGSGEEDERLCLPVPSTRADSHYFKSNASVVIGALFSVFERPEEELKVHEQPDKLSFADVSDASLTRVCRKFRLNRLIDHVLPFIYIISHLHGGVIHSNVSGHTVDIGYTLADGCKSLFVQSRMALRFGSETPLAGRKSFCAIRSELLPSCSNSSSILASSATPPPPAVRDITCPVNTSKPVRNMAIAVGLVDSKVVLPVSTIFTMERLTHISPSATGNGFVNHSNEQLPFFFRTVPPDKSQAQALVDIAVEFGWNYVIALASSNDNYGTPGLIQFQLAAVKKVCLAYTTTFSAQDLHKDVVVSEIVGHIQAYPEARVVILFAGSDEAQLLFSAIAKARRSMTKPEEFARLDKMWLGSDYWGTSANLQQNMDLKDAVPTALVLKPRLPRTFQTFMESLESGFLDHLLSFTIEDVRAEKGNPWLCRFWEIIHGCDDACTAEYIGRIVKKVSCSDSSFRLTKSRVESEAPGLGWTRNILSSTELAVRALRVLLDQVNPNLTRHEARDKLLWLANSDHMRWAVRNVTFNCAGNTSCRLITAQSEPAAAFSIRNFAIGGTGELLDVGYWEVGQPVELNKSAVSWSTAIPSHLKSTCNQTCRPDQASKQDQERPCCTLCVDCTNKERAPWPELNETGCIACAEGEYSMGNRTECLLLPRNYLGWDHPIGIVLVVIVAICSMLVLFTLVVFYRYRDSPVAKASDRHLMNLILVGMLMGYVVALLQIGRPSAQHCTIAKLAQSPPFIFTTATLLIKTSRLARMAIAAQRMSFSRKWTLSISAQVMFIVAVAITGITLDLALTLTDLPTVKEFFETDVVFLSCQYSSTRAAVLDFYVITLILITSIFAFITRKMPMNFNEARHIFLTSFCLCAVWGMLAPPINFLASKYSAVLYALRLVTHMTAIWLFLFTPRLYIFLFRKHRNSVYADVTGGKRSRKRSSQTNNPSTLSNGNRSTIA